MNRAFVGLSIKALDEDARTLEGWASTIDEDRMGDVVVPRGVVYELPIPFLLDHDSRQVVGEVDRVEVTDKGVKFWAHIKKLTDPGEVKDLTDKAWALVKNGLRRATSIGFQPLEFEPRANGGLKFTKWSWYELSAVGIPANPNARITGTKSYSLGDKFVAEDPAPAMIVGERGPDLVVLPRLAKILGESCHQVSDRFRVSINLPEIPPAPEPAATGKSVRVVKLDASARDRAKTVTLASDWNRSKAK